LGVLPVRPILSNPTLEMIAEGLDGEMVHPGPDLEQVIDGVAIGAMEPRHMLERIGPKTLVIVPGDREDVITTLTAAHIAGLEVAGGSADQLAFGLERAGVASGLVLTGGYRPRPSILAAIRDADLFVTIVTAATT